MLLTITTTYKPATDMGYLLHKSPDNLHSKTLPFGTAHVFYPEATEDRCTAALLLDIDPVGLVRKDRGTAFPLDQYVNDRPYVASSFMSVAINRVFGTLISGTSKHRQELVDADMPLEAVIHSLPCRANEAFLKELNNLDDYALAPFHILAHEKSMNMDKDHTWHMDLIAKICAADPKLFRMTDYKIVSLDDVEGCAAVCDWWEGMTAKGGEGMVMKPLGFTVESSKGLVQPGIKCRGSEYLRIIYGPEYTRGENLDRLRKRGLGKKRSLALREYALGYEALKHFVDGAPLHKVHECVFAVLALESEPVDPRL